MSNNKIENAGIHHIALSASDFDASLKFYTEGLGFAHVSMRGEADSRMAMLDVGNGVCIELFANGTKEAQANAKFAHVAISTTDAESAYHTALSAGAVSHMEPTERALWAESPKSIKIAFVKGLDGELIEFYQG